MSGMKKALLRDSLLAAPSDHTRSALALSRAKTAARSGPPTLTHTHTHRRSQMESGFLRIKSNGAPALPGTACAVCRGRCVVALFKSVGAGEARRRLRRSLAARQAKQGGRSAPPPGRAPVLMPDVAEAC